MAKKAAIALLTIAALAMVVSAQDMKPARTIGIEEVRQRLEKTKAGAQAIDSIVSSMRAQYGDQVPVVEAVRFISKFQPLSGEPVAIAPMPPPKETPDGVAAEITPDGFLVRASCRSFVTAALWAIFGGVLAVLPFRIWGDLIRDVRMDGLTVGTAILLAVWASAALYIGVLGAFAIFGEIRISKTGDAGEIFTGISTPISKVGRTHRLRWSEFNGVGDREQSMYPSGRSNRTTHSIGLSGNSQSYTFGSGLSESQRAFVIAFLRSYVFAPVD
jgi:hypothetical protein